MHTWLKFQRCRLKIRVAMPLKSSKLNWAERPQFLSHTLNKSTATLLATRYVFTINEPFQMSQNLFRMTLLTKKWVWKPLATQKIHFECILIEEDANFVKLNDFFTNFTTFEVKTLLKTLVTAHQSLTFALFCQLIAESFIKTDL